MAKMHRQELLEELKANPRKVRFARLCKIAEAWASRPGTELAAIESTFEKEFRRY
jgi:hypothetical protein